MMSDPPLQIATTGAYPVLAAAGEEGAPQLPVGEILLATVSGSPAAGAPGLRQLVLEKGPVALIRPEVPLQNGERLAFQVEGEGGQQTLRVLARSGGPGAPLETLSPGQVRLAQNQPLTSEIRAVLANTRGTILGEVLNFRTQRSAPVRIGSLILNFQLDAGARPGDHLFIRPLEAGGAPALNVFARGGPLSVPPPSGAAGQAQVLRVVAGQVQTPVTAGLPAPGSLLTGTLISVSGPGAEVQARLPGEPTAGIPQPLPNSVAGESAERAAPLVEGRPSGRVSPPAQSGARPAANRIPAQASSPARTALLRFPGFDAEVPWPPQAAASFAPGSPVRVLVNQISPVLDLALLPPGGGSEIGGAGYVPSGEVGAAGFGANLIALEESLVARGVNEPDGSIPEGRLRQAIEGLQEVLRSVVLREGDMTAPRLREAIQRSGALGALSQRAAEWAEGSRLDLREGIQRFLGAVREAELPNNHVLSELAGQAERSLTSVEFLQTVNGLRHFLDEGTYLQIPFALGNEQGTMNIVVRRDGEGGGGSSEKENHSAVFLLELEGLGALRVDAGVHNNRVHVRFTTDDEGVGRFIENEIPKLREAIEAQELAVDGITWILGMVEPEPVVPVDEGDDPSQDNSYISVRV